MRPVAAAKAETPRHAEPSASAKIVREIVRGLHDGIYAPGQRLSEPELMEQFGVSRSTVRESIRRMELEGLVEVLPYRGAVIRRLSLGEALDALAVMELCIGLAARLAAGKIGEGDNRARFEEAWQGLQAFRDVTDSFDMVKARNRFYRTITMLSGNRELQRIIPGIQVHLIRRDYALPPAIRFEGYERMATAILAGDGAAAEAAGRAHIATIAALARERLPDNA